MKMLIVRQLQNAQENLWSHSKCYSDIHNVNFAFVKHHFLGIQSTVAHVIIIAQSASCRNHFASPKMVFNLTG